MKPYEERKARERMAAGGTANITGKSMQDCTNLEAGRTVDKLAEKSGARWQIVVALLVNPERESNRLAALLDRLPTDRRVHECLDDCLRRRGAGRRSA